MRLYIPNRYETAHFNVTRWHDLPFHFERDRWQLTTGLNEAQVIPLLNSVDDQHLIKQKRWLRGMAPKKNWHSALYLIMFHTHTSLSDNQTEMDRVCATWKDFVEDPRRIVAVHLNQSEPSHLHYDFCWHRHQQYYFHYQRHDLANRMWTGHQTQRAFELEPIVKTAAPRRFLIANHVRNWEQTKHMDQRRWLRQFSSDRDCYWSDLEHGHILPPQEDNEKIWSQLCGGGSSWIPIKHSIYNDSWISAYVESISEGQNHVCISEKTYEPLIKGHYIVPLGTQGFVNALQQKGFHLGSLVDYSYDAVEDYDLRVKQWRSEVIRLRCLPEERIRQLWQEDQANLINNRRVLELHTQPTLYEKVLDYVQAQNLDLGV